MLCGLRLVLGWNSLLKYCFILRQSSFFSFFEATTAWLLYCAHSILTIGGLNGYFFLVSQVH